jgi:hypothetical protein
MAVVREGAQVVHAHVHETRLACAPHDPVIQRPGKKFRKNCDDLKLHGRDSVSQQRSTAIQIAQAFGEGHVNAFRFHVNANAKFGCERDQDFALARIDRQQRRAAREFDVAHGTERRRSARLPHFAADKFADEVASRVELRALLDGHLNFQSAQSVRGFDTVDVGKMKNNLAAAAWRKPAALHADAPGRVTTVGKPHFT